MFKPDDTGEWEFRPGDEARHVWWEPEGEHMQHRFTPYHTRLALELIAREFLAPPASLWTVQIHSQRENHPSQDDPLGQRATRPVLTLYFCRHTATYHKYMLQLPEDVVECTTATEAMEHIKTAITRWTVEEGVGA